MRKVRIWSIINIFIVQKINDQKDSEGVQRTVQKNLRFGVSEAVAIRTCVNNEKGVEFGGWCLLPEMKWQNEVL